MIIVVCDRSGKTDTYTFDTDDRFKADLTTQQILDLATHHLGTMTERCGVPVNSYEGPTTQCMYRDGKGGSCALGYFFSDDEYDPKMEKKVYSQLKAEGTLPDRLHSHMKVLQGLQTIHDNITIWLGNRELMKRELYELYGRFRCNPAMLDHPHMAWNNV